MVHVYLVSICFNIERNFIQKDLNWTSIKLIIIYLDIIMYWLILLTLIIFKENVKFRSKRKVIQDKDLCIY